MPLDAVDFFENGGDGDSFSLGDVLKMLGVYQLDNGQLMARRFREQNRHLGGFWYRNRVAVRTFFSTLMFLSATVGIELILSETIDTDIGEMFVSLVMILVALAAMSALILFDPIQPPSWIEYMAHQGHFNISSIPTETSNIFARIKHYLPQTAAVIGSLQNKRVLESYAMYLIVRHDNEEAVIGFWSFPKGTTSLAGFF